MTTVPLGKWGRMTKNKTGSFILLFFYVIYDPKLYKDRFYFSLACELGWNVIMVIMQW
jgi:hypothetical protein